MGQDTSMLPLINRQVETISVDLGVEEATQFLVKHRLSNVPIVQEDIEGKKLVGFLSEADCLKSLSDQYYYDRFEGPTLKVKDIMRRHPVCIQEGHDIFTVANLFIQNNFRHLPVVSDAGHLQGIVSRRDLLARFQELHESKILRDKQKRQHPDLHEIINHRFIMKQ